MRKISLILALFLSTIPLLVSCSSELKTEYFHTQVNIFNTTANFKYKFNRSLDKEISARLDSFDLSLNPFNKNSIIYKVNNNIPVEVDDWFITVFNQAQTIARATDGMYDITVAPLVNLWGFGYEKMKEPTPQLIDSVKQFVGYTKINLEGRKVIKSDPRLQLNASSIAKGYAVDVIAELLEMYGINDYMVEIGGEIRASGVNPNGKYWKIGITKPIDDNTGTDQENQKIIELRQGALATSGNSRNYYIKNGKKYAHTINPLTGYPSESNLLSATVLFPECITADAFATAFMAMGMEKAKALADKTPNLSYIFIYRGENGEFLTLTGGN